MLLKKGWLEVRATQAAKVIIDGVDLLEKIRGSEAKSLNIFTPACFISSTTFTTSSSEEWREENGLMLRDGKVYVSKDERLRAEVILLHHDILVGGHRGQWKTMKLVTRKFWWPRVTKEVKKYVEEYNVYQRNKNQTEVPTGKLMPNAVPEKPWTYISVDFITKLLLAQRYDSILVVCDSITKMAHFVPTTEKTSVEGVVRLF